VLCGCRLAGEQFNFSPELGGIVCGECVPMQQGTIPIGVNTVKLMRIMFGSGMLSLGKLKVEKKDLNALDRVLRGFMLWAT